MLLPDLPTSRRRLLAAGAGGGLAALLAACGADPGRPPGAAGGSSQPRRGGTVRIGAPPPATAVDPVTMYDGTAIGLVQLVGEYLIWLDRDLRLVPRLATERHSDAAGRTWTFRLRPGVAFSDGTVLDAGTVKSTFDRLLDPGNRSAALPTFAGILAPGGVRAPDPRTVVFSLQRPFSDFPYLVSAGNYNAVILKKDYAGSFTRSPIGTGPFRMTAYDPSTGATFTRNPQYWDTGKPYLDEVRVRFYADDQADLIALQSGDIDAQLLSRAALALAVDGVAGIRTDRVRSTGFTALTMRVDRAPFDRKEVRQAVAYALDRAALQQGVGSGIGDLGNDHLFAPLFPAAPADIEQRSQNPAKVRELLGAAGVDKLAFRLTFETPDQDTAVAIQSQLKACGITVDLDQRTSAAFYGGDQRKDTPWLFTDANLVRWVGRPVPSALVSLMVTSRAPWNGSKYANPVVDAAARAYDAAGTAQERAAQAKIIAAALHEDTPVIIPYWSGAVRAHSSRVSGVSAHPSEFVDLTGVHLT